MTARNYCQHVPCDHLTREAKRHAHGTPEMFEAQIRKSQAEGFITAEDAADTIEFYRVEYEAAPVQGG